MCIKQTKTEIMLSELCGRTFLNLWSYANPYKQDTPEHQECCDVIAIFENHIFVFFDRCKPIDFTSETNWNVRWKRWYRDVIEDQIKTCYGAERYIKAGGKLYIDNHLSEELPITYDLDRVIIHKIVVAHGAKEACLNYSQENIHGSLAIMYGSPVSERHEAPPFCIRLGKENPVHIFDSHNLELMLTELDTFQDFTNYIMFKECLIKEKDCLFYTGEEDFLAYYFISDCGKNHIDPFGMENAQVIVIEQGWWWEMFVKSPIYQALKEIRRISSFWDDWINELGKTAREGNLIGNANAFTKDSGLYEMAKEPRYYRWLLSGKIKKAIDRFHNIDKSTRQIIMAFKSSQDNVYYVFLQYKMWLDEKKYCSEEIAEICNNILDVACGVTKPLLPNVEKIVGIGMFKLNSNTSRMTLRIDTSLLMDCSNWNKERDENYKERNKNALCGFKFKIPDNM